MLPEEEVFPTIGRNGPQVGGIIVSESIEPFSLRDPCDFGGFLFCVLSVHESENVSELPICDLSLTYRSHAQPVALNFSRNHSRIRSKF
jgi:hypothetical protein